MKISKSTIWLWIPVTVVLILALAITWQFTSAAEGEFSGIDEMALQLASQEYGAPVAELKILNTAQAVYNYSGQSAYDYKILNQATNEIYVVSLDSNGQKMDASEMVAADLASYTATYGKIDLALYEALASVREDAIVPVIIALVEPEGAVAQRVAPEQEMTEADYAAFRSDALAQVKAAVGSVTEPFMARLQSMGYQASSAELVAYVFAQVKAGDVRAIAEMPDVRAIGLDVQAQNQVDFAWYRTGYDQVYARRIVGRGKLAAIEVGHGTDPGNPFLRYVVNDATYRCTSPAGHETGVLGIMYSSSTNKTGLAMGTQMWTGGSCGGWLSELSNRESAAVTWGADAINNSWGYTYASATRTLSPAVEGFYDDLFRNTTTFVVFAAGNYGDDPAPKTGWLGNPAGAYNIMTVGAENKVTPATIAGYSSYVDPDTSHDDMEKPEVTAPGSSMNSTLTASPWIGGIGNGTSFAAPIVTSMVGNAGQRSVWILGWPEVIKAALMASATRNIEGSTTWGERDGQGGVYFPYADNIFQTNSVANRSGIFYYCSTATETTLVTLNIPAGKRIRFAIAWDTYSAYASYATQPSAALDLGVYNSAGPSLAWSSTWDNTYEILDWTPTATGNYTFKVYKNRCSGDPNYLGWAYYRWP